MYVDVCKPPDLAQFRGGEGLKIRDWMLILASQPTKSPIHLLILSWLNLTTDGRICSGSGSLIWKENW